MAAPGASAVPPHVARRAVEWWVDRQSGRTDDAFTAALARWRAEDPAHDAAWRHIEAMQGRFGRLTAGTGLVALRQPGGGYTLMRADGSAAGPVAAGVAPAAELPTIDVRSSALRAESYRAPKEAGVLRSDIPLLDTAQAVNIVPAQVCATSGRAISTMRSAT